MINWRVRLKNPLFWVQLALAAFAPVLAYLGITAAEITSWPMLGEILIKAAGNPYVLGLVAVSIWNAVNDPTTAGLKDSRRALAYDEPNNDEKEREMNHD